jgi:hypothetical protein
MNLVGAAETFDRNSTLSVSRGLYVLRYVGVQGGANPPIAHVRAASGNGTVEFMSPPWLPSGQLARPGDCLVIRADRSTEIMVGIKRDTPGGTLDASFRLEPLSVGDEADIPASSPARTVARGEEPAPPRSSAPFTMLAHISMRGDVVVSEDEWAGGPDAPSPIEGLELRGEPAEGLSLEMQVLVSSRPPRWSNWVSAGEYAGTRGRYLQLIGVRLRLGGQKSDRSEIAADALFLGSLVASKRGREVEFLSKSGVDPLVGLRLGVAASESLGNGRSSFGSGREREGRVRVFRTSVNA